ncbi:MAG: threonine/serine exporter family protein [Chroococcidiopsidaceae cyanobacterium CP_BM_ER_R8_30]|nr:threonine/serine exporter family protein [Chroococcidiopsidaceae cyanobacterium CP_BM_ER_R8_30]
MLRAGDAAFRVRQWMGVIARRMDLDALAVQLALGSINASARRDSKLATLVCEIGAPSINTWKISALEEIARNTQPGMTPRELAAKLAKIEAAPPLYSITQIGTAVGVASGAFAFLNGGTVLEVVAAAISGGFGQCLRSLLLHRRFNQYAVTMLCAMVASGIYCLIVAVLPYAGFGIARHTAGFISSVLFLVPGFPLVAALIDLLQHQTVVALQRLAYGTMLLLTAALGLCIVIALVGFTIAQPPSHDFGELQTLVLRALASFSGSCGFAILYNSSAHTVLAVGILALVGNGLRLALHDAGMMLAPATLLGALAVGLMASLVYRRLKEPRMTLTVPGIIMMVPGLYAFQTIVLLTQGAILSGLQAAVLVGFVIGAMAVGLAAARFVTEPRWLRE